LPHTSSISTVSDRKIIAIWLLVCCVTIYGMIVLGGITRLTGSGLSMVQWAPIMGVLPPLNQEQWQETFALYQQYPEYILKNHQMSLHEFKSIFWFEYSHRLLGRSIGIIFLLPFLFFLARGKIERSMTPKLVTMFVLGGLQGLLGWYMVKSGLVDNPRVSQYRLTAHLGLAVIIYSYMLWVAFGLLFPKTDSSNSKSPLARMALLISGLVFITILSGGFVAGTHAGYAYNTFPFMEGKLVPDGLFGLSPLWRNFFENIITVQFDHRVLATLVFLAIGTFWFRTRRFAASNELPSLARTGSHLLLATMLLQVTLGISTLLLVVPIALAAAHQAGAILLLTASLFASWQLQR